MAKRARPAHTQRLVAELSPAMRAALQEMRTMGELGPLWQNAEDLQVVVTHFTCMRYARRLQEQLGIAEDVALEQAALHFDIKAETIRSRYQRWYRCTRDPRCCYAPAAGEEPLASSESTTQHTDSKVRGAPE